MMKAIVMRKIGAPDVLQYVEVPRPKPLQGQVLVRAHSIGVGMPEVYLRRGQYKWMPPLPAIPGIEMSGQVEELGEGVSTIEIGQPVFVSARELPVRGGCYAEFIAVESNAIYRLPEGVDLEAAAALSNYQVAWHLLHTAPNGMPYTSFLATAAAGGVGSALIQLGQVAGKRVLGLVNSEIQSTFASSLGAGTVMSDSGEGVTKRILELTSNRGVDLIFDSIGGPGFFRQFERLAPFGLIVSYGSLEGIPGPGVPEALRERMEDCLGVRQFSMHAFDNDVQKRRNATDKIIRLLALGEINPPIWKRMPLSEAGRAHSLLEGGAVLGKIILKP